MRITTTVEARKTSLHQALGSPDILA